jgi:hypothetical protein
MFIVWMYFRKYLLKIIKNNLRVSLNFQQYRVPSGFPGGVEVYEPGELPGAESVEIHHEDGRHGVHIRVQVQQDLGSSSQFQANKKGGGGGQCCGYALVSMRIRIRVRAQIRIEIQILGFDDRKLGKIYS